MKPYRLIGMVFCCGFGISFVVELDGAISVDTGDIFGVGLGDRFDEVFDAVLCFFSPIHTTLCG